MGLSTVNEIGWHKSPLGYSPRSGMKGAHALRSDICAGAGRVQLSDGAVLLSGLDGLFGLFASEQFISLLGRLWRPLS
ncbi:MAG: hypothetical protein ACYTAO_10950, partial [Planctomycetota bacterium]